MGWVAGGEGSASLLDGGCKATLFLRDGTASRSQVLILLSNDSHVLSDDGVPLSDDGVPFSDDGVPLSDDGVPLSDDGIPLSDSFVFLRDDSHVLSDDTCVLSNDGVPVSNGCVLLHDDSCTLSDDAKLVCGVGRQRLKRQVHHFFCSCCLKEPCLSSSVWLFTPLSYL